MPEATIYIVDDDPLVRDALHLLLRSVGLEATCLGAPQEMLARQIDGPICLITDLRMPVMSGIELFEALRDRGHRVSAIVISGHADVPQAVKAMKAGALDFLQKPFNDQDLLDATNGALRALASEPAHDGEASERLALLTQREQEVLQLVVEGQPNKLIARALDVSTRTVEAHRAHLMEKLQVGSLAELVRLAVAGDSAGRIVATDGRRPE